MFLFQLALLLLPSPALQAGNDLLRLRIDGDARLIARDFKGAVTRYSRYLEVDPNNIDVLLSRGLAYFESGKRGKAGTDILAARKLIRAQLVEDRGNARLFYQLANSHRYLREYKEAVQHLETAVRLDPTRDTYRIELDAVKAEQIDGQSPGNQEK